MPNPVIELAGLHKSFGSHQAVNQLSLDVPAGQIYGFIGPNGAGKTTTLRMIMDIIKPDVGEVKVLGQPMSEAIKDRVGYLPEERGLYPKMKALELLTYHGSLKGLSTHDARRRARSWLERVELADRADEQVQDLSKGMQQKVQFALAALTEPELLVLDEPFSGMDPVNQNVFKDLVLELHRNGSTIVFSTHQMEMAEKMCSSLAMIHRGRLVLNGALHEIKRRFGSNAVLLGFDGDGSFLRDLPGVLHLDEYGGHVELRLDPEADPRSILAAASAALRVHRFERVTPSLHSIFLEQVAAPSEDARRP
jgi:ABC-2 type transport system ATP-binding protein